MLLPDPRAQQAGEIADGLISTAPEKSLIEEFSKGGDASRPRFGQMAVCWAATEKHAKQTALKLWPTGALAGPVKTDLPLPSQLEAAAELLRQDDVAKDVVCGPDPEAKRKAA